MVLLADAAIDRTIQAQSADVPEVGGEYICGHLRQCWLVGDPIGRVDQDEQANAPKGQSAEYVGGASQD